MRVTFGFLLAALSLAASVRDNPPARRWALILEDPGVAAQAATTSTSIRMTAATPASARIAAAQRNLRAALAERKIPVTGTVQTLMNAVFVEAAPSQVSTLRSLPGVRQVIPLRRLRQKLNTAIDLVNVRAAWTAVGGMQNAGAGVKIGIIDTGIDQNHPAFLDSSLTPPANFPKCSGDDCKYTNKKVIVARSYVSMLTYSNNPEWSRPDDLSPRDRQGHGTAVAMVAAGNNVSGPVAGIVGVAPKAFLGNYKVTGSPGVNDYPYEDTIIAALEDAYHDGMDVVSLSYGWPAYYGPLDQPPACSTGPCDILADAVETAVRNGMLVVVAAGNSGASGYSFPSRNTINSPATAPSALAVGASTNSHIFFSSVKVSGSDVPSGLDKISALFGNGPRPASPVSAPLRDVTKLQDNGTACSALPSGSLAGVFALVQRGTCAFADKVNNAQAAGAVGVVMYQLEGYDSLFNPGSLENTGIPLAFIGNSDGKKLKNFLASHADRALTLDPSIFVLNAEYDTTADFSSRGPSIGTGAIKPEVAAVGTDLYVATQKYDPNGELWDPSGYAVASGTSFAAPFVAGAAALAKQKNPNLTALQLKSAVVNTATSVIDEYLNQGWVAAPVISVGAGKLNAGDAVKANVTVNPTTVSFGVLSGASLPTTAVSLEFTNPSNAAVNLALSVKAVSTDGKAQVTIDKTTLALAAGQTATVAAKLEGTFPLAGSYEGYISVSGGASTLRIPYLYIVSDGTPHDLIPLGGDGFLDLPGGGDYYQQFVYKVVDQYGAPVANVPARFLAVRGGGTIQAADEKTDKYGIVAANALPGSLLGEQEFSVEAGNMTLSLFGRARNRPAIRTDGVVNAASLLVGQGLAPGSYISIFGSDLSDSTRVFTTSYLPLALAQVSVSFDVPSRSISVPGRLHFVSANQINVQIPWELQGLTSAQMKVSFSNLSSVLYTIPLNDYSPACFEYTEAGTNSLLAAALDENYKLVGTGNALARGHIVQLYANGLGPVDAANQPASGEPAPAQPLVWAKVKPTVTIGGKPASVEFYGLAPYNVGLYQLNVVIPADAAVGLQPVVITVNGVTSKSTNLPIR
jgi:minor extracellular serine protease Vpr